MPDLVDRGSPNRVQDPLKDPGWTAGTSRSGGECGRTEGTVGPCPIGGGAVFRCRIRHPLKDPGWTPVKQGEDSRRIVDTAPARFDRESRAVAPQSWRGMTARRRQRPAVPDGCAGRGGASWGLADPAGNMVGRGRRGAMSNRRGGRASVSHPTVGCRSYPPKKSALYSSMDSSELRDELSQQCGLSRVHHDSRNQSFPSGIS